MNNSELSPLLERMKKGQRVGRDDLPESLHILEECVRLHSAEYAVKIQHLENRVDELEKEALAFRAVVERPNKHHPDSDPSYVSGFNDAIRLFDDVCLGQSQALKMLLIEKQIETARRCAVASTEWALMHIEFLEEQLKEEKSKC